MNIVHCLFTMETGGAQILAVDLLNEMSREHSVCLVIVNNKFNKNLLNQLNSGIHIFYINRKEGSRNPLPVIKLNLLLLKLRPDIIHCHEPHIGKLLHATKAKRLYTVHDVGLPTSSYRLYNRLIAVSEVIRKEVSAKSGLEVGKICNGIGIEFFKQRSVYSLGADETIRFVQVSRLFHEKKGQEILLHALGVLKLAYLLPNFTIDFIGSGNSLTYLKALAEELGLASNVHFLGERDRKWLYQNLCSYHVLIQPSKYEGFGLTVIEGFAAGIPVLASNIDGPAEIITGTPGGFLFRNGDHNDCAQKLYRIVELYRQQSIEKLMLETNLVINQRYGISSCSNQYVEEYAKLSITRQE